MPININGGSACYCTTMLSAVFGWCSLGCCWLELLQQPRAERKRSSRRAAAAAPAERSDIFSTSLEMFQTIALSRLKQHIY